jgi:hypothetical protein
MDNLIVKGNDVTPSVCLDKDKNVFSIGGRSIPENAIAVYSPIIDWWKQYILAPNHETLFEMNFEYINSSSMKQIARLFAMLDAIPASVSKVSVRWHYTPDDLDSKMQAERLAKMVKFPIEIITDASK